MIDRREIRRSEPEEGGDSHVPHECVCAQGKRGETEVNIEMNFEQGFNEIELL